jgi:hypothetical protein
MAKLGVVALASVMAFWRNGGGESGVSGENGSGGGGNARQPSKHRSATISVSALKCGSGVAIAKPGGKAKRRQRRQQQQPAKSIRQPWQQQWRRCLRKIGGSNKQQQRRSRQRPRCQQRSCFYSALA